MIRKRRVVVKVNLMNSSPKYNMIGTVISAQYPSIITGIILEDESKNISFTASVLEAQELISKGELEIPIID